MSNGIDVNFLIRKISNRFTIYIGITNSEDLEDLKTTWHITQRIYQMTLTHTKINVILLGMAVSVEHTRYFNRTWFENGIEKGRLYLSVSTRLWYSISFPNARQITHSWIKISKCYTCLYRHRTIVRKAGDLRRHRAHYDVIVMSSKAIQKQ